MLHTDGVQCTVSLTQMTRDRVRERWNTKGRKGGGSEAERERPRPPNCSVSLDSPWQKTAPTLWQEAEMEGPDYLVRGDVPDHLPLLLLPPPAHLGPPLRVTGRWVW